jgi:L,D-peptidoglycan transpeptidase YkuD (ErfK/YbiS/YcfS/YnhG family)
MPAPLRFIRVLRRPGNPSKGLLIAGNQAYPCALGRGGVSAAKREGDGASPRAVLRPVRVFYRDDAGRRPVCRLPLDRIRADMGWVEDPRDRRYNRLVNLPYPAAHETMRREDNLYDIVVELDWNRRPAIRGRGSAIFMHLARPGFTPTQGCIGLRGDVLRRLLPRLTRDTAIIIR